MKKVSLLFIICTLLSLISCTKSDLNDPQQTKVNGLRVTAKDFVFDGGVTKTSFSVDEQEGMIFKWSDGDILGIYPVGGDQVAFPISEGEDTKSAVFDGGSWALRPSKKYACYYPFSMDNYFISEASLPVSFIGQSQCGNNSTSGLGAYDYMAAPATSPDEKGCLNITMDHLVSIVRFELKVPSFTGQMSRFIIKCVSRCITTAGTYDLTQEVPQIISTAKEGSLVMNLSDILVSEENNTVTLFMMMCPDNLSDVKFDAELISSGGDVFSGSFYGKDMTAGTAYSYSLDLERKQYGSFVDLGLSVKWADLNAEASAGWLTGLLMDYDAAIEYADKEDGRLPTKTEINELMDSNNCQWTWVENYDGQISGFVVTSKKPGYTSNSIFLPASGGDKNGLTLTPGLYGNYWTSDKTSTLKSAYFMYFTPSKYEWRSSSCSYKYSVRLVKE